ncbi:hypothetical protein FisN_29Hh056 [Fistulifera solaris]|uniref:Uncharacterized protein n=1 Tax=Fistulifera solaris TaxID=1519565 RepID=A0A1Z5K6B3_FISSO|nr:hypothetical protein FisN_29Hh056 [Fistulifera solaris]|eukprot:GAX21621.1 hypothetical protein FisN_29Hh056 [Fistulifera solaris]
MNTFLRQTSTALFRSANSEKSTDATTIMIDNTQHVYIRVTLKRSRITAQCRPAVLSACPEILQDLDDDLCECLRLLPKSVHPLIRRTCIWINSQYAVGPIDQPVALAHATAHHHRAWLLWAKDCPDKQHGIEIYNCFSYRKMRWHWNGCGLILHELCHLIHQFALGLDNSMIRDAYQKAKLSEKYEQVLRRDWAGLPIDCDLAYAMVDEREFFAELSVTYWSHQYKTLDNASHTKILQSSPPFLEPTTRARLGLKPLEKNEHAHHCNKFYPFTRGQLRHYDAETCQVFDALWTEIAGWEDPFVVENDCYCWHPFQSSEKISVLVGPISDTVDL